MTHTGISRPMAPRRAFATLPFAFALLAALAAAAGADETLLKPRLMLWRFADASAFQEPRGIAFDPLDGAIYVSNAGRHRIEIFSKTGRALGQFVHRVESEDGKTIDGTPCALAFDRAGHLLVADLRSRSVDVLDRRGRRILRLPATAGQPNALAVGPDGAIWVATTSGESKVYRFRPDYRLDGSWGEEGTDPGRLNGINALCVLKDGSVAVACARTDLAVQIFTASGQYLRGFGKHDVGEGNFSFPSGLIATADGRIWVIDEIRQCLQIFDDQGTLIAKQGEPGTAPGEFAEPSSITYDGGNSIALTDRGIGRVQVFTVAEE